MWSDVSTPTRRSIIASVSVFVVGCVDSGTGGDDSGGEGRTQDDGDGESGGTQAGTDDPGSNEARSEDTQSGDAGDSEPSENGNPVRGEIAAMGELTLTSPAFDDGERIPEKYGYDAENVSPPLEIDGIPEAAETLALVVDDPDAVEPAGKVWDHWIVWNVPPETTAIPEGWEPDDATEGTNDFGEVGYGGPSPPDTEHRYRFKLFALDSRLDLPAETDAEALGTAMDGHVLARTQLDGTYPA